MYLKSKGIAEFHPEKTQRERYFLPDQVERILSAIEDSDMPSHVKNRDHALIYLTFYLGLRCGEACLLQKKHFRELDNGSAFIPTLKKALRLRVTCECGRRYGVSAQRSGQQYPCPRCGVENTVPEIPSNRNVQKSITPEMEIPVLEEDVREYIREYIASLPKKQQYLFISRPSATGNKKALELPLSRRSAQSILATYQIAAGINAKYSYHALRHGRGVQLYDVSKDLQLVKTCLRHEAVSTSEIYVHLSPARLQKYSMELSGRTIGKRAAAN